MTNYEPLMRPIPDFPGYYIDRAGGVFSDKPDMRPFSPDIPAKVGPLHEMAISVWHGYRRVGLQDKDAKGRSLRIARLLDQVWGDRTMLFDERDAKRFARRAGLGYPTYGVDTQERYGEVDEPEGDVPE